MQVGIDVARAAGPFPLCEDAISFHENQRGELTTSDTAGALNSGGGKPGQCYPAVCVSGDRTHALTSEGADASEDGTGRGTPIVACPDIAAPLTAGTAVSPGVNPPGRRKEDDTNLVAFSPTAGLDIQASDSVSPTLKAGHDTMPSVHTDTVVRRLTELECERLQGYPDGWTGGQSGAARYRQLGNSVAVPVVEWIARRLTAVDGEVNP